MNSALAPGQQDLSSADLLLGDCSFTSGASGNLGSPVFDSNDQIVGMARGAFAADKVIDLAKDLSSILNQDLPAIKEQKFCLAQNLSISDEKQRRFSWAKQNHRTKEELYFSFVRSLPSRIPPHY